MHSKLDKFTTDGKILMLALDHRGSFRRLLNPDKPDSTDPKEAIDLKLRIISSVYDLMSGVLVDPDYGLPAYNKLQVKDHKNFLMPIEKTGYDDVDGDRVTNIEYTIQDLIDMGANGVKLLIYYHPDSKTKNQQIETAGAVMEMAKEYDFPYFLEIVTYNHEPDEYLIVDSVKDFVEAGVKPDVFKLEYPGNEENCKKITEIVGDTPWILLTKGDDYESFAKHLKEAVSQGASGFLAGRSLWQEVPGMTSVEKQNDFLTTVVVDRFKEISEIVLNF